VLTRFIVVGSIIEHSVEWDTLIFFAAFFVFVESLNELGLIREMSSVVMELIMSVEALNPKPRGGRMMN